MRYCIFAYVGSSPYAWFENGHTSIIFSKQDRENLRLHKEVSLETAKKEFLTFNEARQLNKTKNRFMPF